MPRHHLTDHERYLITHMHLAKIPKAEIARRLGRHRATIGRELARNPDTFGGYHYESTRRQAAERRSAASRRYKIERYKPLGAAVRRGLRQRWSPDQISGKIRLAYPDDPKMQISPEAVYLWIYRRHQLGERWHEQLRRRHKRRRVRCVGERSSGGKGQISGRVGIEKRPAVVDARRRYGDWESDTVEGAKGTGLLATHVERKSRYTLLAKLPDKKAKTLSVATNRVMKGLPQKLRRTGTADNGKEFADFKTIEKQLGMRIYFADPHAPWQRGANENTNGLLRDWWPKGHDMRRVSHAEVARVQRMLNNRPRKCLGYRTPLEVLNALPGVALQN